ncbi:Protein-L-isoaspartate O-methyltransferase domain-containing protein 1 isoform X2 [Aphelenchoides bicaudatus]|nr:Protein-L-isoaspartate O-methyltransferase domain-containing protein 1 isoform X2 [Aphelenchoides bicaudatus]
MGAAPSSGQNNDELVDGLIDSGYIHYRSMEFAFRIVDRGDFFPEDKRTENAYKDQAWRSEDGNPGFIHLSAPCIYANALEYLDLRPGLSFLNIGSGSGYFNTVAGYLLTEAGTNHGVELFENMIEYADSAQQKHSTRPSSSAFSFCEPEFFNASAFYIKNGMQYDRIYVGALVPNNRRVYFCQMLKIGGILVLPYGSRLLQIVRKDVDKYFIYKISNVSFSSLIDPTSETPRTTKMVELPRFNARSLAELCRTKIRAHLRRNVFATHPIQMQFEIGLTKEVDEQPDEENQMERIGTFYFANRRNRQAAEEERAQENQEAREEQNAEVNEDLFEHADPVNEANETPEAIRNLLRTPPMDEQPNVNQANEENEPLQDNFEVWSPEHEGQQNDDPMPEQDEHELEDGMDAERAAMIEAENQNEQNQEAEPQPGPAIERHQPLPPPNIAIAPNPRFQIRRQRLHVNLVNGNRLVGFLNQGDDEDEDLFREADERNAPTEPVGLAVYDKSTSAVFHTTDVRPTLDHIDMKQILPNYEPPKPKPTKSQSSGEDDLHRDAGTVTEDIRSRRTRFDVRIAMRPTRNDNPHQRLVLRHANYGGQARLNQQPSTSMADQQPRAQEVGTQTDVDANLPNNPPPPQRMVPIEAVHHIFHGLHQGIDALHRRQQLGQLRDRLRRFHPIPSHVSQVSATSTTGANAASSVSSNATTVPPQ